MKNADSEKNTATRSLWLVGVLVLVVVAALTLQRMALQDVVLPALAVPAAPESPYARADINREVTAGLRFRSEPLLPPFGFTPDPYRRKIRAFELAIPTPVPEVVSGTLYFDTRAITFNPFGDEIIPTNQLVEAHPVQLTEIPRNEILAAHERGGFNERHPLSATKRLFEISFEDGEPIGRFQFVYDEVENKRHLLQASPRAATTGSRRGKPFSSFLMFGEPLPPDQPLTRPPGLAGYHPDRRGNMNLASITADKMDGRAVLRLDGNYHYMDAFGDPTGMSTDMSFLTIPVRVVPLDVVDPSDAGRLVLRLEFELKNPGYRPSFYFGGDSYSTNALFDLVVTPASNGRHRLLIWDGGELKKQVGLHDAHALHR